MAQAYHVASGRLRDRITILPLTQTRDETTGDQAEDYVPRETVWGKVTPIAGNERFASMQIQSDITHMIEIRPIDDIKPQWRVRFDNRTFQITAPPIDVDERGRKMQLMCREMTN